MVREEWSVERGNHLTGFGLCCSRAAELGKLVRGGQPQLHMGPGRQAVELRRRQPGDYHLRLCPLRAAQPDDADERAHSI